MSTCPPLILSNSIGRILSGAKLLTRCVFFGSIALAVICAEGCGGMADMVSSGNTSVTLLSTSTANDRLSDFDIILNGLTLTEKSGSTVNLITTPIHLEFIHVNAGSEPFLTVSVPQGTYTSAVASIGVSRFGCVALNPSTGGLVASSFLEMETSASNVNVNLPTPISVAGQFMALSLDLLVSQSATWTTCHPNGIEPYTITPTFRMNPLSSKSINGQNELQSGLSGLVASVDESAMAFTVTAAEGPGCIAVSAGCVAKANGPVWQVYSDNGTLYEGISGASQLAAGMPVEMDAKLLPGGSLLATRIAVHDPNTVDLTVANGPLLFVSGAWPVLNSYALEELGPLSLGPIISFNFNGAAFRVSSSLKNLNELPFPASFNATNIVAGQVANITTHALHLSVGPTYVPATTVTLVPQTITGTVRAVGNEGNFTTYDIAIAPYNLFSALAVQSGQTTLLTEPDAIVVYADTNAQMLTSSPITVGSVARFYGLVFNDNGTLRMDCAQINDGVAE